jgi:hypothetical protein
MSHDPSNLGYYDTYEDGMTETTPIASNGLERDQLPYISTHSWPQVPAMPAVEVQWSLQYYPRHEGWYDHDILSASDMASEASCIDDSATPSLHRSNSGEFSEVWDQEPLCVPFSPFQMPASSAGLLNSIGSSFVPLQLPPCASASPEEDMQQFGYMIDDLRVNDSISTFTNSDSTCRTMTNHSPLSEMEGSTPPKDSVPSPDMPIIARQRRARQAKEPETAQPRLPTRVNSTRARLFCEACRQSKDYSRGFRGEHELARHYAQKHTKHKKVWKCFDLSADRLMRNCERCKTGHQYGTSYGGAEHFRRKHTALFGKDMMELLRGKNQRWALSSNRLIEEGWLRQVYVPGDGEPFGQEEEQSMVAMNVPLLFDGASRDTGQGSEMRMIQAQQPFCRPHDADSAWTRHRYQQQSYAHQQLQQNQQHPHQQVWQQGMS